jgi:hypothetical protein
MSARLILLLSLGAACQDGPCPSACDDLVRLDLAPDGCEAACSVSSEATGTSDALAACLTVAQRRPDAIACFRAEERTLLGLGGGR